MGNGGQGARAWARGAILGVALLGAWTRGGGGVAAETLRVLMEGTQVVSLETADAPGDDVALSPTGAAAILLDGDLRFFRGVQIELQAPQAWIAHYGALGMEIYAELDRTPEPGAADVEARRIWREILPAKVQNIWLVPLITGHGLRTSPYAAALPDVVPPGSFPLLFRLLPVMKGVPEELERMEFRLRARPILGDEGAVRVDLRYPPGKHGRPVAVFIDGEPVTAAGEERLLREGEHDLVVLSEDYRSQSRRFRVERARVLDLLVELQDTTPLLVFEAPENAVISIDGLRVGDPRVPVAVEPGVHEVRFRISDYTIVRPVTVQRGKTYRVALSVDVDVTESE